MPNKIQRNISVDKQSLGDTHEMLVKALPGQSYVKETMHKVSTTQVTGEALKKISVGGKGGFGSQGDARDQEKQVIVTSRVMVMSDPVQEVFNHNASLEKIVGGWDDKGRPIYIKQGESLKTRKYVPSHLFGDPTIKGWIEFTKSHGRDYDEFSHSGSWDASDAQRGIEMSYINGLMFNNTCISQEDLDRTRALYDELCGYKDAWKYLGIDGAEHRRYVIYIYNTLNLNKLPKEESYVPKTGWMSWEASSYNHHVTGPNYELYLECNPNARKDHNQFMLLQLSKIKNDTNEFVNSHVVEDREDNKRIPTWEDAVLVAHKMQLEADKKAKLKAMIKNQGIDYRDWRVVYNWELKVNGKSKFA